MVAEAFFVLIVEFFSGVLANKKDRPAMPDESIEKTTRTKRYFNRMR